jgi:WD40 repeat protein
VYAAGSIGGPGAYDFGNGVTATGTNSGGFLGEAGPLFVVLVKYNSSGSAQWARSVAGGPNSYYTSVAVGPSGSVYAAGGLDGYDAGTYDFGNGASVKNVNGSNSGEYHVAVVRYNSAGVGQWAYSSVNGGSTSTIFASLTVDATENVYVAGGIASISGTGSVDFGNNVTATATYVDAGGGWSALLVKYQ